MRFAGSVWLLAEGESLHFGRESSCDIRDYDLTAKPFAWTYSATPLKVA